jgi:hypothetical protein
MKFFTLINESFEDIVSIKKNVFILLLLCIGFQILLFWRAPENGDTDFSALGIITSLIGLIILQFFHLLFLYFFKHKRVDMNASIKIVSSLFLKILIAVTFVGIMAALGFVLLIVPGLLVMSFLFLVEPIMLFENKGIKEAILESFERTKKVFLPIFLCIILYVAVAFSFAGNDEMSPFWLVVNGVGAGFFSLFYSALMQNAHKETMPKSVSDIE